MFFAGDDGKVNCIQLQKIFDKCGIQGKYTEAIFKVLCQYELAIPLDKDMLLLPSTLQNDQQHKLHTSSNCNFPGIDIPEPKEMLSGTVELHSTGMCYRRLCLCNNVPEKLWFRLVPQFISSAQLFYNILLNNCIEGMTLEKMATIGDAVIGDLHCKCLYWKNSITLTVGDKVLFCINGLMQCGDMFDDAQRCSLSVTTDKIKSMQCININMLTQLFPKDEDGIEVNVPDYVVHSSLNGKTHTSCKLGPQIQVQVFEILNELCIAYFKGDLDKGIYSEFFNQVVVCPYCFGDSSVTDTNSIAEEMLGAQETSLLTVYERHISTINYVTEQVKDVGCYGFNIQICILEAQKHGFVCCPKHGRLNLHYLTPDLVSIIRT